ncbi:ras-related and estrogen-regulated growth inhibitor-like protein [Condylostylus longicornis]|uniref:ras-related and estrogen-regulated growth inhibitor-like protein n=1 Tax=Condylostylus longicornis TaxID=2530218 RepID=UPI00244E53F3|nr:ras-related and estrogen-regulated growth inhibitor-like protein [Condylostylus longicornis]
MKQNILKEKHCITKKKRKLRLYQEIQFKEFQISNIIFEYRNKLDKMKAGDKNAAPLVRLVVLGNVGVGKSALTVRYLTKRFIGEYRSNTDLLYRQTISLDSGIIEIEIVDISSENENEFPTEQVQWADACVIVYSITDRKSFEYAGRSLAEIKSMQTVPLSYLVGNKADLDHLRKVNETEGASLAATYSIGFCEISVAENSPNLYKAFDKLLADTKTRPVKQRKFSVSKMIGNLIGVATSSSSNGSNSSSSNSNNSNINGNSSTSNYNINNSNGNDGISKQTILNQGTVVPCHKGELLHKSRGFKQQRQPLTTTNGSIL